MGISRRELTYSSAPPLRLFWKKKEINQIIKQKKTNSMV
jgi:hypothetical protein